MKWLIWGFLFRKGGFLRIIWFFFAFFVFFRTFPYRFSNCVVRCFCYLLDREGVWVLGARARAHLGSWRSTLGVYGIFGLFVTVIWILLGKEADPIQTSGDFSEIVLALKRIIKIKEVWLVIAISFSYMLSIYGLQSWLPKLLELKNVNIALAGVLASISNWFGLLGSLALPVLGRRISRKYAIILSILIQGIMIYLIGTSLGIVLILSLILYGIFSAGLVPLSMVTLMEVPEVGSEYMGVATGLLFSVIAVGGFIGPCLVGYLLDVTGSTYWGIVALTVIMELSLPVSLMLKE